jgi:hypothetical protein
MSWQRLTFHPYASRIGSVRYHRFEGLDVSEETSNNSADPKAEKISRVIVAVMTCLGALGLAALIYFPLRYLQ